MGATLLLSGIRRVSPDLPQFSQGHVLISSTDGQAGPFALGGVRPLEPVPARRYVYFR